jgi:hypothetical protein
MDKSEQLTVEERKALARLKSPYHAHRSRLTTCGTSDIDVVCAVCERLVQENARLQQYLAGAIPLVRELEDVLRSDYQTISNPNPHVRATRWLAEIDNRGARPSKS